MGLIFWLIIIIILATSVAAWFNTKIIMEDLARIKDTLKIIKKRKIKWRRHFGVVPKRIRISRAK